MVSSKGVRMRHKYKKMLAVFFMLTTISVISFLAISNVKQAEWKDATLNKNTELDITIKEIHTVEEYLEFAENVNSGNDYKNCEISLCSNLDFKGYDNISPIGSAGEEGDSFRGVFNGNGYSQEFANLSLAFNP